MGRGLIWTLCAVLAFGPALAAAAPDDASRAPNPAPRVVSEVYLVGVHDPQTELPEAASEIEKLAQAKAAEDPSLIPAGITAAPLEPSAELAPDEEPSWAYRHY